MRRIDHVVLAVRDLEQTADLYRRLGFQVGARNRHPWGTENRLIQFGSSFIELITVGQDPHRIPQRQPRQFSFGEFVRNYLRQQEGIAMLVLSSDDACSDAALFAHHGIGDFEPFSFSRKATRPDGSETQVGFTLAFATDPAAPELGFFVCQQHYPENFWNRVFQQHPNAAVDISGVTLAALQPERHRTFLSRFSGTSPRPLPGGGLLWDLSRSSIEVLPTAAPNPSEWPAMLTTLSVQVPEPGRARSILAAKGFPCTNMAQGVIVPAEALHGVSLRFTHIQHPGAGGSEPD